MQELFVRWTFSDWLIMEQINCEDYLRERLIEQKRRARTLSKNEPHYRTPPASK